MVWGMLHVPVTVRGHVNVHNPLFTSKFMLLKHVLAFVPVI